MPYYEIIYETGTHSIAFYEDDDEANAALSAHHERALSGQVGGPTGHAAERIVKALVYDVHPDEFNYSQTLSGEEVVGQVTAAISKIGVGGQVSVPELAAEIRNITNPMVESGPHESNFKMPESRELPVGGVS